MSEWHRAKAAYDDMMARIAAGEIIEIEATKSLDMKARPCGVCGHGSLWHYADDEDEVTESGIILRRAACHYVDFASPTVTRCDCKSYDAR
jgi:hypothetical protein